MNDLACAAPRLSARSALIGWIAALATVTIWALWAVGTRHAVTHDLPPAAIGLLRFGGRAPLSFPSAAWAAPVPKGLGPATAPRVSVLPGPSSSSPSSWC